jgi:transposase
MSVRKPHSSDLTDEQWTLVEPLLSTGTFGGRPELHPRRDIVDAILYRSRTRCAWRQLPDDFPPWETVYWHFKRWRDSGLLARLEKALEEHQRRAQAAARWPPS